MLARGELWKSYRNTVENLKKSHRKAIKKLPKRKGKTPCPVIEEDARPWGAIAAAPAEPSHETTATTFSEGEKMVQSSEKYS